jgi:SAM-dependent methyltransferase
MGSRSTASLVLTRQCRGEIEGWRQTVAQNLLDRVIRRRKWSLHRHVHLVQAFDEARGLADGQLRSVLSVGCGAAASELFLAVSNPDVSFTLTDTSERHVRRVRWHARLRGLRNVKVERLDLLASSAVRDQSFDFVCATEVIEHIEDDRGAAQAMMSLSNHFAYVLVPFTTATALADEDQVKREWDLHGHHRPGYTHETLAALVEGTQVTWLRNCYFEPEASELRARLDADSDAELRAHRAELVDLAMKDLRGERVAGGRREAQGVKVLVAVG